MISREQLAEIAKKTGMHLYQQEKDYLLKLFLFNYYRRFEGAVFKGGTCIKYLFGMDRFSEDLDFNIRSPKKFRGEVSHALKQFGLVGIKAAVGKEELFREAYTAEISFEGPLFAGRAVSLNKFRIDAGYRLGTMAEPKWNLVASEYPETTANFMVKSMDEGEMLAEKVLALVGRKKGRDLFDVWFLMKRGVKLDGKMLEKKAKLLGKSAEIDFGKAVTEKEYVRDLSKLSARVPPYGQVIDYLKGEFRNLP
ncbi:nucleotidyl transferase AbiEii/AbiGii toxin family protein [Candidatus Micrarchaeota archaeon]|nr:nucleotidyl transferase AbiEii/AbiGii toxin family protein [Candidatus Micrarchaeota archaeon]MBU1939384.1 nucleotidyl transferase AbiEii/AbiGii toxin family protein [Candidatus Micrarchaeota archaeon]